MMDGTNVGAIELKGGDIGDTQPGTASAVTGPAMLAVTSADLQTAIKSASTAYVSARDNAANAAATVYYIWLHTCSEHASAPNKQWYLEQFDKRRDEINSWNADLDTKKKREEEDNKKKVKELQERKRKTNDPDRTKEVEKEITAQQEASKERLRALADQRKVKLEARATAADYTAITKFVLELDKPKQSSQVNRFATVVKWIATKYAGEGRPSIEVIAKRILDEGGFDNVYDLQSKANGKGTKRTNADTENNKPKGDDPEARQAAVDHFRKVVDTADGLATLPFHRKREPDSLVALIGRVGKDGVTVISEVSMPVERVLDLCVDHRDQTLLPGDAGCEFVATALAAGALVEDGKTTQVTRELSMLANSDSRRLVISALNTDVSVVVRATPKATACELMPQPGFWKLDRDEVKQLGTRLEHAVVRKMVTLSADNTARTVGDRLLTSAFAWKTTSGPLATKGDPAAVCEHRWLAMSPHEATPLDIEGFFPAGTVTLSRAELLRLVAGKIGNWTTCKSPKAAGEKKPALAEVTISRSVLKVRSAQGEDEVSVSGSIRGAVSLMFRPRMLADAIAKLAELCTGDVQLSPDQRGALGMGFEDAHGSYDIFLPACDDDGALKTVRFANIIVPETDGD